MKQDERTERLFRNMKCLENISRSLVSSTTLQIEEIVHTIYKQASTVIDLSNCFIVLYDTQTQKLHFPLMMEAGQHKAVEVSSFENSQEFRRAKAVLQSGEPLIHQTQEEAQTWWTQNQHDKHEEDKTYASWVGVPIFLGERNVGVVAVYNHSHDYFYDDVDIHFLKILGNQAGMALRNTYLEETQQKRIEAELNAASERTLRMLAHRIKNYLGVARLYLNDAVNEAELMPRQQEKLDQVDANVKRCILITQNLFKPYQPTKKAEVKLYALIADAIELLGEHPEVKVDNSVSEDLPTVWIEAGVAVDYIYELLINAIRAVQERIQTEQSFLGHVEVRGYVNKENKMELHFTNNGPSIPQEQWEEIFQQFSTVSKERRSPDNFGLGLWGTRTFFRRQNGDAYLLESNDEHTTFVAEIPLA